MSLSLCLFGFIINTYKIHRGVYHEVSFPQNKEEEVEEKCACCCLFRMWRSNNYVSNWNWIKEFRWKQKNSILCFMMIMNLFWNNHIWPLKFRNIDNHVRRKSVAFIFIKITQTTIDVIPYWLNIDNWSTTYLE